MDHIAHLADSRRGRIGRRSNATIAFLREHKTVMDPTQSWNELLGHAAGTPIAAFQPGVAKIPAPLNRVFSNAGAAGIDAATARAPRLERGLRIVKALHDAGVPVVAGTDEGIPGHSVHREIELYVEAGLTPMRGAAGGDDRAGAGDAKLDAASSGRSSAASAPTSLVLDAEPARSRFATSAASAGRSATAGSDDAPALWKSVQVPAVAATLRLESHELDALPQTRRPMCVLCAFRSATKAGAVTCNLVGPWNSRPARLRAEPQHQR